MTGWWRDMDLTPWCGDYPQGTADFGFALAVANERARRRGVRQRVTLNRGEAHHVWAFVVEDVTRPRLTVVAS